MAGYKVYLKGLGFVKYTDKRGKRRVKIYLTKKGAERRFNLEKSRGFNGRIQKN